MYTEVLYLVQGDRLVLRRSLIWRFVTLRKERSLINVTHWITKDINMNKNWNVSTSS